MMLASGCAGLAPSQVGQTAGTIAGAAIAPGVGAPVGALVGLMAGMVVENQLDRTRETHERRELSDQLKTDAQALSRPTGGPEFPGQPTRVWVDESAEGGRLASGHFETRNTP